MPKFSENQAHWLVAFTQAVVESPSVIGRFLEDDVADSVEDEGDAGGDFLSLLAGLTVPRNGRCGWPSPGTSSSVLSTRTSRSKASASRSGGSKVKA